MQAVLREIGAENVPQIMIYNKCDVADINPGIERRACGTITSVVLSALTGDGIEQFRELFPEILLSRQERKSDKIKLGNLL